MRSSNSSFSGHIPSLAKQSKNDPAGTITGTIGNSGHSHHTSHQGYHTSNGGHSLQISAAMAAAAASGSNSPYHSRSTEYPYPPSLYTSTILILIVTVAIVIVIIACSFAYVYVKLEERKVASNTCFLSAGHGSGYTAIGSPTCTPGNNFKWISGHSSSHFNQSISSGSSPGTVSSSCASTPGGYKGPLDESKGGSSASFSSPSSSSPASGSAAAGLPCVRNLLNPRPPVPTFLWASQGPISEEDSDDLASNSYATLPFDRLLLHKDQGGKEQEQMATQAIPLESSSTSSPSKGGSICVSAQVHPHQNKSAGQTMEIFVNNMYDIPDCHLGASYSVSHAVTAINDQVTNNRMEQGEDGAKSIPFKGSTVPLAVAAKDDSHGTYSSNQLHEASANELSWQNNLPQQETCEFISSSTGNTSATSKSHGSDSCQDDLSHCTRRLKSERISQVTMNANCSSNFSGDISSHGISHKSFIHRQRELNECDINSSSGTCASGSLASFNSSSSPPPPPSCQASTFVSSHQPAPGERESQRPLTSKLRPHSYCFANSTSSSSADTSSPSTCDADTSNLLYRQNHNQGNQKEQGDQLSSRDQRPLTRKSCVISAV